MYVEFDWDDEKAASNLRKHGISFSTATLVFFDPDAILEQDRFVDGEERWQILGMTDEDELLVVAHITRDEQNVELIRIISARRAEFQEKLRYGDNR
jgi:uncharacterized DUF497 family protein